MTEHLDLIRRIAWNYVKTNPGLEFDDLFSEACIAYLEGVHKFNPKKGKISTYIWAIVSNQLNVVVKKEYTRMHNEYTTEAFDENYFDPFLGPEQQYIAKERWKDFVENLSIEAYVVYDITINQPHTYLPTHKPKKCRGIIMRELRDREWTWEMIWETFREIKLALSTII